MQSLSPELSHKLHNGHLYLIANTPTWESSEEFIWTGKSNIVAKHRLDPDDISIQLLLNEIRHKIKLHKWKGIRQLSITIPVGVVLTDKSLDRIGRGLRDCLPDLLHKTLFNWCRSPWTSYWKKFTSSEININLYDWVKETSKWWT